MADGLPLGAVPRGVEVDGYLEALHLAIRLEEEGLQFFTLSLNRMRNPRGRAAFGLLLRDEREHVARLRGQLAQLLAALKGTPDEARLEQAPGRAATVNPLFSHGRTLLDRDADEREVIRMAIGIEWDAIGFYQARAEAARDAWSRQLYADLAGEEREHYERLVDAYETMIGRRK